MTDQGLTGERTAGWRGQPDNAVPREIHASGAYRARASEFGFASGAPKARILGAGVLFYPFHLAAYPIVHIFDTQPTTFRDLLEKSRQRHFFDCKARNF
jgi:hypothetical protein